MSWKKNKDGGIDYDVEYIIKRHQMDERHRIAAEKNKRYYEAKEQMFDPMATACTMTFDMNVEEVPVPPQPSIKDRFAEYKRKRGLA